MKNYKNKILLLFLCIVLIFTATSCNDKSVLKSSKSELAAVMSIGGLDVPMELYRYVALNQKRDHYDGDDADFWVNGASDELKNELNAAIELSLKKAYANAAMCVEYGIDIDNDYITKSIDSQMKNLYASYENDYKAFEKDLTDSYMTDGVYRFFIKNEILADELMYVLQEKGILPSTTEEFDPIINSPEIIRVKQILISSDNGKSDDENYQFALSILDMLNDGADFDTLIGKYGMDMAMFNNPDGYYICHGLYHEEFEKAAYGLEVGETSGVIKTNAGYSIIKRYKKDADYVKQNFDKISDDYLVGQYNILLDEFMNDLSVEYLKGFEKIDVLTITMK